MGTIAGLLAAVTVLRWYFDGAGEAAALLYVVPVAPGALRFGRRGGLSVAALCGAAFIVLEAFRARGDLDLAGWAGPLLAMALIGGLVGHLSDVANERKAHGTLQSQRLEEQRGEQRSVIEASDSIGQHVAAARWMLEAGEADAALAALGNVVAEGIIQVSRVSPPLPPRPGGGDAATCRRTALGDEVHLEGDDLAHRPAEVRRRAPRLEDPDREVARR